MDANLRQILSKSAGTYFIVTDKSQVAAITADNKLRLIPICVEKGPVNILLTFAKGDKVGFTSVFGKATRTQEVRGNFSHMTCLDALDAGPISVINLRNFNELDTVGILGLNPNILLEEDATVEYKQLFNTNGFWVPAAKTIPTLFENQNLLNFGNVGNGKLSIFVVRSKNYSSLTSEGDKSLINCSLDIDEFPALDFNMLLKDTFVDVYVFNNDLSTMNPNTNMYYGHLFNADGQVDLLRINELAAISESGFSKRFTGSLIPGLISGTTELSIDTIINQQFMTVGLICNINEKVFEIVPETTFIDVYGDSFFDISGAILSDVSGFMLSHVVPESLTTAGVLFPPSPDASANVAPDAANTINYYTTKINDNEFLASFEQGIRFCDNIKGVNGTVHVSAIEILDPVAVIDGTSDTYTKVKITCDGPVKYFETAGTPAHDLVDAIPATTQIFKLNTFSEVGYAQPFTLVGYVPRLAQFLDGTATRQNEVLDLLTSPGIVKGIKGTPGIRYIVDAFKSFVEVGYKHQFGILAYTLDQKNCFIRCIIAEPFTEDLQASTNPLFKQTPGGVFDWSFVPQGGNKNYSTINFAKFIVGSDLCFFFGPGQIVRYIPKSFIGKISNLFYAKAKDFDVVANASGYLDGVSELEAVIDDDERAFCEAFRYNPVIDFNGITIYGNLSGQKEITALQQVHNSELLAYVKQTLFNLSKSEAFKKGNYDDYLRTETENINFMEGLALAGAIQPNYVVICNASNNTLEIQKAKIKLVHIEFTPVDALEKIVFDLQID